MQRIVNQRTGLVCTVEEDYAATLLRSPEWGTKAPPKKRVTVPPKAKSQDPKEG